MGGSQFGTGLSSRLADCLLAAGLKLIFQTTLTFGDNCKSNSNSAALNLSNQILCLTEPGCEFESHAGKLRA